MGEAERVTPESLAELARGLDAGTLAEVADFIGYLRAKRERELDAESKAWQDNAEPLEPYEWGSVDPMTLGEPVVYVEGVGAVTERG